MSAVRRLVPFAFAGGLAFVVDAGVLVLTAPYIGPFWGRALSFLAGVGTTWVINRNVTFKDRRTGVSKGEEFLRYLTAMLPGAGMNWLAYGIVASIVPHTSLGLTLAVAAGSIAGLGVNFLAADKLIYKKSR
ncbi:MULTISPECIES: GtrA family protein [unclassified Devosia]|uniref:GtrA family protein n=1 Tax=unclassified Devosia TaxID=196773 RepID=UPI00145C933A|nr:MULTISPECIES: GtrA family protein [unclassified Devosia]MBJ6989040.1 GtrA family protein [Devosia sp. MC521]QMW63156.1 GtrA family protein [Devosia sp. MC521]